MKNRQRPKRSVFRREGLTKGNGQKTTSRGKQKSKKQVRSSTKSTRVQSVIDCWHSITSFHPTVKLVTSQLGQTWTEREVRQILEVYGPKNGIHLTEFQRGEK